jgi:cytochrome oxidase Cu insertion factor (SCO1/SenC/PrrC family)
MDNKAKFLIYTAVAHMFISMMTLLVQSRKRKRRATITYAPIDDRDRMRREYFDNKVWKNDTTCVNMLRLRKEPFFRFCKVFRDRKLLKDTIHMSIEEQVAMFLHTVGHIVRNRVIGGNFGRSGEVVSRYFKRVLHAIGELRDELIRKPSMETSSKIEGNHRWDPYFKV